MMIIEAPFPNRYGMDRRYKNKIITNSFIKNKYFIEKAEIVISYAPRSTLSGEISKSYLKNRSPEEFIQYATVLLDFYLPKTTIHKIKLVENKPTIYPSLKIFIREYNVCAI